MHATALHQTGTATGSCTSSSEVRSTFHRGIETPLHALRASLEEIGSGFSEGGHQAQALRNALGLIETVERNAQVLTALAAPGEFVPMRCTLDELARSAVRSTSSSVRNRVLFAVENADVFTQVDGPSFSRWLSHLIHSSVARRGETLLRAQVTNNSAVFTLICSAAQVSCSEKPPATDPFRRADDQLLLRVAEQEIRRMGGTFERFLSPTGTTHVCARFPLEQRVGETV